jgi:hypothetical protein
MIPFILACSSFILVGCGEEKEATWTPCDMNRKYRLVDVRANIPIDLNFDGIENIDLTKEMDIFQECFIYFANDTLIIAWPEIHVSQLKTEIPANYTAQDIEYSVVPRKYTYWANSYDYNGPYSQVFPVPIDDESRNYYGFVPPGLVEIDKEQNTITFCYNCAHQYFPTKEGIQIRVLNAVFKPDDI